MVTLISFSVGAAVTLLLLGLFRGNRTKRTVAIRDRVERIATEAQTKEVYDDSFAERLIYPMMQWFVRTTGVVLPSRITHSIGDHLSTAGMTVSPSRFVAVWLTAAVIVPLTMFVVLVPFYGLSTFGGLVFLLWVGLGLYLPWYMVRRAAKKRTLEVDRLLPDAIDLIVTCVESGIGLQAAMIKVSEFVEGPVALEFSRVSREVSVGRARDEALEAMAERTGSREMRLFVRAIVQAEAMGISIGSVLRNQATEVRQRRQQRAREMAATIPVKITIPTVMFIFPTLFLLILGPVALNTIAFFSEGK